MFVTATATEMPQRTSMAAGVARRARRCARPERAERGVSGRPTTRRRRGPSALPGRERPSLGVVEVERQRASVPVREEADQGEEPRQAPTPEPDPEPAPVARGGSQHQLAPASLAQRSIVATNTGRRATTRKSSMANPRSTRPRGTRRIRCRSYLGGGVDREDERLSGASDLAEASVRRPRRRPRVGRGGSLPRSA